MTIPISTIVNVTPSVIDAGANAPILSGLFLSQSLVVPTNRVLSFSSADSVGVYFGYDSTEYDLANRVYFQGYTGSFTRPGALLIAPYNLAARSAFLQSGFLTGMTLAQLQAAGTGVIALTVDGTLRTSSSINLSGASSFSNAATLIQAGIGASVTVAWNSSNSTFVITSATTGATSTITYATDTSGVIAQTLLLRSTDGGVISQGAALDTPASCIATLLTNSIKWCMLTTLWEPTQTDKLAFASAISATANQFGYAAWDTDANAIVANSTAVLPYKIAQAEYNNTVCLSGSSADCVAAGTTLAAAARDIAVFTLGFVASIDFTAFNGRATEAFKQLAGLIPTVSTASYAANLLGNGYNYYGVYANASNQWEFLYNGSISGIYKWLDSFVNQVYLNAQFQNVLITLLLSLNSIPYNADGYNAIKLALAGPITDAINFGSIRTGVPLSDNEIAVTTAQAGLNISSSLTNNGYYLQVLAPTPANRALRKSPIVNFWYTDGQSIQQIFMDSIDIL